MLASKILRSLPASVNWLVLFKLPALRPLFPDDIVRSMFSVPLDFDLASYSHVILSSQGTFLAPWEDGNLLSLRLDQDLSPDSASGTVYGRFQDKLGLVAMDDADCIGIGESKPYPPVLLYIRIDAGVAQAQAVFMQAPSEKHYELLRAVGVEFLGGEQTKGHYVARYRNRLPAHVLSGLLSRFSRTEYCNLFFLRHGNIDSELEHALEQSAANLVAFARVRAVQGVAQLAGEVCAGRAGLTCYPPSHATPFPFGDIVPLGFMLKALRSYAVEAPEVLRHPALGAIDQFLHATRQGLLWSYHSGGLVTATDSALVLQGFDDCDGIAALEIFNNGTGAYSPQLCSDHKEPERMVVNEGNRHWCQPDYATTCLVQGLRRVAGFDVQAGSQVLVAGFANRSGLFFANPYMVDWCLASAIAGDASAGQLRQDLRNEILISMNTDYSFGLFDVPLSTAFAILSLAVLGVRGRLLRAAQLRLLEFQDAAGIFPAAIPFYSTVALQPEPGQAPTTIARSEPDRGFQIVEVSGRAFGVSHYVDSYGLISTAVSALALSVDGGHTPGMDSSTVLPHQAKAHSRYRCSTLHDYLQGFALPPYVQTS